VTRGGNRARIVLVAAGLAAMTTFATPAVGLERLALWQVVQACIVDFKLTGAPFRAFESIFPGRRARRRRVAAATVA